MKYLFSLAFVLSAAFFSTSCKEDAVLEAPQPVGYEQFFKQNMAIFDARVRSINENNYVRELYLPNFAAQAWEKNGVGYEDVLVRDNGEGNDLVAKDGIYTSVETFAHDARFPYNAAKPIISVMERPIVSEEFVQHEALNQLEKSYDLRKNQIQDRIFEITCKVEIVPCPNTSWYNTSIFGEPCVKISDCSVTIGF